ncbi:MAG: ABC transporter substrate-binding protein [Candidatus Dormibacteria bacterium]
MTAPLFMSACGGAPTLRIGAVFPLSGFTADDAREEELGAQLAARLVNDDGGAAGRLLALDIRDVEDAADAQRAADSLRADGVPAVIGAYSSALSIPLAAAVARDGMVYWETGAVADQVTGHGYPLVFRVGADGRDLGGNSGRFIVQQVAPQLGRPVTQTSAYLVTVDDAYGHSVADAAHSSLSAGGVRIAGEGVYDPEAPQFAPIISAIQSARPDVLVLSSHVNDGIAFRRAFVAAHIYVAAFFGTTMAQCQPEFGDTLGPDATGVFASDRPGYGFNPAALDGDAAAVYQRFAQLWSQRTGHVPSEEGISGFAAAWALFHDVLTPGAQTPDHIAATARSLDLPSGSLPNGAGIRFSNDAANLGQNLRAAAVIWQWQAPYTSVVIWPGPYATGSMTMVPMPRTS